MTKARVLILEDDVHLGKSLVRDFEDRGYQPYHVVSIADIGELVFEYAVLDMRLGGEFGLDAIKVIRERSPGCQVVILSGYGSIASAVEAVKLGAQDYLSKPASFSEIEAALLGKRRVPETSFQTPSLSQMEHEYIDFVLTKNQGNISKTAKDLGLHRQSLQRKLKKYT